MIYRKLSLFLFFLFSLLPSPFAREKYGKRARLPTDPRVMAKTGPTFTTDEYSQPLITSFSRRSLRLYPASPRPTTFPPSSSCRYLKRRLSLPRETETEQGKEGKRKTRRAEPVVFASRSYFGERVRPRKPRFPSSLSTALSTLIPGSLAIR